MLLLELTENGVQALPRESPSLGRLVRTVSPPPLSEDELLVVARQAVASEAARRGVQAAVGDDVLRLALALARSLLPHLALPGSLVRLLTAATGSVTPGEDEVPLGGDDLFAGWRRSRGCRGGCSTRASGSTSTRCGPGCRSASLGQPEAVDALVERIALIKAGLCDPERPYGVLLFVGPTGTGKTELAPGALAEELFGSPERMVRVDMSELKDRESVDRLIGEGHGPGARVRLRAACAPSRSRWCCSTSSRRREPVWDLFLQVFDAGRLTDRAGRTVGLPADARDRDLEPGLGDRLAARARLRRRGGRHVLGRPRGAGGARRAAGRSW